MQYEITSTFVDTVASYKVNTTMCHVVNTATSYRILTAPRGM